VGCYMSPPCGQRTASSFYRPRGGSLQSCCATLSATCGSMAYSVVELTVVLTNLASGGRYGESCARPEAALRVAALELLFGRGPYTGSRAGLTEDRSPQNGRRGDVSSIWVPTVLGMTLQCPGWRYSGRNGRTGPKVTGEARPAGLTSRFCPQRAQSRWSYPFRGAAVLLQGGRGGGGTGVGGTVSWNDTGLPAQRRGWPHSAGWSNDAGDDSHAMSEGQRGRDSPLTWVPVTCQSM
jgi:hypothetical protein